MLASALPLSARGLDLSLQIYCQLANARLAHRFEPAHCFIQDSALVLRPIRIAGDAAELSLIITGARRTYALNGLPINRQTNCRHAREFDGAGREPD